MPTNHSPFEPELWEIEEFERHQREDWEVIFDQQRNGDYDERKDN